VNVGFFMGRREIVTTPELSRLGWIRVDYSLPLLRHCFVFCSETDNQGDLTSVQRFAEELALTHMGDRGAYMLLVSGASARRRPNFHVHVFLVRSRWQKAWVYAVLSLKNVAICLMPSLGRRKAIR
jgi:hypothetical protein